MYNGMLATEISDKYKKGNWNGGHSKSRMRITHMCND